MKLSLTGLAVIALVGAAMPAHDAKAATTLNREPATLRLGERVLVDDGICPTGQIREILGVSSKDGTRVERRAQCISRRR
jgi:hypothetical protein